MIERFNFYDLYGYVLPGLALVGLLWLPYGIALKAWPPMELASAVFAVVLGYLVGLILHELSRWFLPSFTTKVGEDHRSYPSDDLLDKTDNRLSDRQAIKDKIKEWYGLDAEVRANRSAAFAKCRNELLQKKRISYAEQFQGMYALYRGLAGATFLAAVHLLGWALSAVVDRGWSGGVRGLAGLAAVVFLLICVKVQYSGETRRSNPPSRWPAWRFPALSAVLGAVGVVGGLAARERMNEGLWAPFNELAAVFGIGALVLGAVTLVCVGTYQAFLVDFARTVYRDFLLIEKAPATARNES